MNLISIECELNYHRYLRFYFSIGKIHQTLVRVFHHTSSKHLKSHRKYSAVRFSYFELSFRRGFWKCDETLSRVWYITSYEIHIVQGLFKDWIHANAALNCRSLLFIHHVLSTKGHLYIHTMFYLQPRTLSLLLLVVTNFSDFSALGKNRYI